MSVLQQQQEQTLQTRQQGLTLIEVMVVVAIIAILAGIGYPLYTDQVRKARRADAQGALYAFANAMEQHAARTPNTGYAGAADGGADTGTPAAGVFPSQAPLDTSDKYYNLTISSVTLDSGYGVSYELTAAPTGKQSGDDCGNLTLTSAGVRGRSGTASNCWK